MKNVYFEDSVRVKLSSMAESQDLYPISSERSTKSRDRSNGPHMASRPQSNGTAERMVQTLTRSIKSYVIDENKRDWDEYAERLTYAINTAQDQVRGETPFYLIHGLNTRKNQTPRSRSQKMEV